ncbi:hypothetical protein JOB18_002163 [Solea senegalensis]|uniref:Protein naked cuticle homolog n=1 Tax=Solea senegalensis TaxID=28829 RepID=A0AAV6R7F7_SOLSE|nr:hypothetical protein JOB18_002163 [Solea senegalensis]
MGKLQSKLALKRRQSPEGGSLASSVLTGQRELEHSHKSKVTEKLGAGVRGISSDYICNLQVVLTPKKTPDRDKSVHLQVNKETKKKKSNDTQTDMVLEEDSQQEWTFTLYNVDNRTKATKKDMSSMMHSMCEALEASVKQPCFERTPLKIKLAVSPSTCPNKISQTAVTEQKQSGSQETGCPVRKLYCVDENIERRNHYLDLAGIENYTSKFDNTDTLSGTTRPHLLCSSAPHNGRKGALHLL